VQILHIEGIVRLEWLEDLLAVAETGSFQEAADRRRLTQSAFSRRIQQIEDHVGVELFDRTRKPVQLRATTAEQRDQIARIAADLRQLVIDLQRGERMASNRLTIASQHALTTALAPSILKRIHGQGENIHFRLRSANLDECFALLLSRQADICLVYRLPGEDHPIGASFVETAVIGTDRLIPVIATSAAPALNDRLAEGELPYIAYPGNVFFGKVLESQILPRVRNITRPVAKAETALTLAAIEMAAVGVALAWVPGSLAQERLKSGSLVDLSASFPSKNLEITTVRLFGSASSVARTVWSGLI
jgi:LysR family transcriptional regulator, hypochlorite-specific transcription factor HypT